MSGREWDAFMGELREYKPPKPPDPGALMALDRACGRLVRAPDWRSQVETLYLEATELFGWIAAGDIEPRTVSAKLRLVAERAGLTEDDARRTIAAAWRAAARRRWAA